MKKSNPGQTSPLSSGFMLVAMLGFIISLVYTIPYTVDPVCKKDFSSFNVESVEDCPNIGTFDKWFGSWGKYYGIAFMLVFFAMFIASFRSMTRAKPKDELKIDAKHKHNAEKFVVGEKNFKKIQKKIKKNQKKERKAHKKKATAKTQKSKKKK